MTAADVMDGVPALLNDTAKSVFSYTAQIPYLNIALAELQEIFELYNVPATNNVSSISTLSAGSTQIVLPTNLIALRTVEERAAGTTEDFSNMEQVEFLPMTQILIDRLGYYQYDGTNLNFLGSTQDREVKYNYIKTLFAKVTASTDVLYSVNTQSFLTYRTAALCAEFIGENLTRAQSLNQDAQMALDRTLGISAKSKQDIFTRRRPFMSGYKARNLW